MPRPAHPWFREQNDTWYVKVNGRQVSLGVKGREKKADAMAAWHRLMSAERTATPAANEPLTVNRLITAFLADAEPRVKPITLRFYRRFLLPFAEKFGESRADSLTTADTETYARKPTWSSSTRHDCLGTLAIAFRWATRTKLIAANPLTGMRMPPKESAGADAVVSEEDFARLMEATTGDFRALLRFLWLTGCRPMEAAGLTVEVVDWTNACIRLKQHKTAHRGKARTIYLTDDALTLLTEQRERHGSGLLFRNNNGEAWTRNAVVSRMWRLQSKLGIQATAYGMRHSFATDALSAGVPEAQVAELLGHSGTAMLNKHYGHLSTKAKALRDALDRVR